MQQRLSTAATPQHAEKLSSAAMFSHAEMLFAPVPTSLRFVGMAPNPDNPTR